MTEADRLPWDELWMGVADLVAMRSDCDRRQVGAAIVDRTQRIIATGYNGPPAGTPFAGTGCVNYCERGGGDVHESYQNCPALHAEANALLYSGRHDREDGKIYVSSCVCMDCAKLIANSGLARLVMRISDNDEHRHPEKVTIFLRQYMYVEVVAYDLWRL